MQIINNTPWTTRSLRKILVSTVNRFDKLEGKYPNWRKYAEIQFLNSRGSHYTGYGEQGGLKITIRLPRVDARPDVVAALIEHQYSHNCGYTHKQMPRKFEQRVPDFAWALEKRFHLDLAPVKEHAPTGRRGRPKADPAHKAEVKSRRISRKIDRLLAQIMALEKTKGKLARKTAKAKNQASGKAKRGPGRPPQAAAAKPKKIPSGRGPGRPRKIKTGTK